MERKMRIMEIMTVENCLRRTLLPVKDTGLGYHINKNLIILERKLKEHREVLKKLQEDNLIKDSEGKPQYFKMIQSEKLGYSPEIAEDGSYIKATEKDNLKDFIIDNKNKAYLDAVKAWEDDELEVDIFDFPKDKVLTAISDNKFDGIDITPLLGIYID